MCRALSRIEGRCVARVGWQVRYILAVGLQGRHFVFASPPGFVFHAIANLPFSKAPARGHRTGHAPRDGWSHPEHDRLGCCGSRLNPDHPADHLVRLSYAVALAVLYRHARNRARVPKNFRRAAGRATAYALFLALPWASMAVLHLGELAHDEELILVALGVGMAASGIILLSAVPAAAFSYMSGILIPTAVKCLVLLNPKGYVLLGILAQLLGVPGRPHRQDHARDQRTQEGGCCT
jgi:hypothetical protein